MIQSKTAKPVRFEITETSCLSLERWMQDPEKMIGLELLWPVGSTAALTFPPGSMRGSSGAQHEKMLYASDKRQRLEQLVQHLRMSFCMSVARRVSMCRPAGQVLVACQFKPAWISSALRHAFQACRSHILQVSR